MRKFYPWLWFDADGTLFDYDRAEAIALQETFHLLGFPFDDGSLSTYRHINQEVWKALERHEITPAALHIRRFELLLEALQLNGSASQMGTLYLEQLALRGELMDGAHELLHQLQKHCRFALVTNGFRAVQRSRVANSPLREFFAELVISEEVGAAKPKAAFFEAAWNLLGNPAKAEVLVIGDNLVADMLGGAGFGLDTCWYNPNGAERPAGVPITYEIADLRELLKMLAFQ